MQIRKDIIESLNAQGIYVSMFPSDEARQKAYEQKLAQAEKDCQFVNYTSHFDETTQQWVKEGDERPDYKQYAKERVDKMFDKTTGFWGMWYDAETVYMRKGDVFAKRKVSKSQGIKEEWVKQVLEKEAKAYSGAYGQFAKDVQKMFAAKFGSEHGWVYPTTYGIGVWVFYNWSAKQCIANVESVLKDAGIEYTNEFSDARWVYRFKISKKEVNRNKLTA